MAQRRPTIPIKIRRELVEQAGGKCANPGCPNRLIEFHHIQEWAIYHTHDENHMIALCPSCHDSVDRGKLTISDEEIYSWKGIQRNSAAPYAGSIFVEPMTNPMLRMGFIGFRGPDGVTIVEVANQRISMAVRENELAFLNLKLVDPDGNLLVDVVDNYVRQRSPEVSVESRAGRWRVRGDALGILPKWAMDCLTPHGFETSVAGMDLLDIEVTAPGEVGVSGVWVDDQRAVISNRENGALLLLSRRKGIAINCLGERPSEGNKGAFFIFTGNLDKTVFETLLPSDFW